MKTWTIKVDESLDRLVEEVVKELWYTSKAELVREAVKRQVLEISLAKLGIASAERHATHRDDPLVSLERIIKAGKKLSEEELRSLIDQSRKEVEDLIFGED